MSGLEGLLTGQTLVKRYRIQEVIGRGGFAAVYRAHDERLGRPVAVKVITIATPDQQSAEQHRERFEREARAAASLPQHPNVVTVYDFGVDPVLGLDFLVMELLDGEDLATRLRTQGRPSLETALRIIRDAATGIAVGHRAGIVHRDVKPGNIFLAGSEGGAGLRVCILDFGIARVVREDQTLTRYPGEGTPLSPAYASPEQTHGARELTPASDVFSLGVVAYQLLTGEKPFPASKRLDRSEWIPQRSIRELNAEVPERLESAVLRALGYAPEDRYADAEDFAAALAAPFEDDVTLLAAAPPPPAQSSPEADQTLYAVEPEPHAPRAREYPAMTNPSAPRRRSMVGPLVFLLLLVSGGVAGWWFLGSDDAARADPAAVADLETVSEALEDEATEAPGAATEPSVEPGTLTIVPANPSLRTAVPAPRDTGVEGLTPDTLAVDSPALPATDATEDTLTATNATEDTVTPTVDRALPPPRVLGVPVDSLPPPSENLPGEPAAEPPPAPA